MNDLKPFKHGQEGTHYACNEMLQKLGGKTGCCGCNGHKCNSQPINEDDEGLCKSCIKKYKYYHFPVSPHYMKPINEDKEDWKEELLQRYQKGMTWRETEEFIRQLLADQKQRILQKLSFTIECVNCEENRSVIKNV